MTIYDRATKAVTPEEQFEVSLERRVTPVPAAMTLISLHVGLFRCLQSTLREPQKHLGSHTREKFMKRQSKFCPTMEPGA